MINLFAFTNLIPAIIGGVKYRKLTTDLKAVTWLMVCSGLLEMINTYIRFYFPGTNNMYSAHLYNLVSFACLSVVYREQLPPVISRNTVAIIGILGCAVCVLNTLFVQSILLSPSYARTIMEIVILGYSLIYLYKLIVTDNKEPLWSIPMFWVNTGILLLFGLVFFINLGYNQVTNLSKPIRLFLNTFRQLFLVVHYLSLGVALWIYRQK